MGPVRGGLGPRAAADGSVAAAGPVRRCEDCVVRCGSRWNSHHIRDPPGMYERGFARTRQMGRFTQGEEREGDAACKAPSSGIACLRAISCLAKDCHLSMEPPRCLNLCLVLGSCLATPWRSGMHALSVLCACLSFPYCASWWLRQERIIKQPYGEGENKEFFKYSLFIVLCNRVLTCSVAVVILLVSPNSSSFRCGCTCIWRTKCG